MVSMCWSMQPRGKASRLRERQRLPVRAGYGYGVPNDISQKMRDRAFGNAGDGVDIRAGAAEAVEEVSHAISVRFGAIASYFEQLRYTPRILGWMREGAPYNFNGNWSGGFHEALFILWAMPLTLPVWIEDGSCSSFLIPR